MRRRDLLQSGLAASAGLALPAVGRTQGASTLKFIPQSDLAVTDPVWTTADVTRNHAFMVFDTLYGLDDLYTARPQMVAGHVTAADGKQWDLTLRPGLSFHDGTPVLARDAVASILRWAKRDGFGARLMAVTDELSAPDDKTIRFRLRTLFPLLPEALATPTNICCIVPERLARTDPNQQMPEVVGSGPFRFVAAERVSGARMVYAKFAAYQPRQEPTSFTAGGKPVYFDRVEWNVVPDAATAAAALAAGEADWWENPVLDLVPSLKANPKLNVGVKDPAGEIGCMRFNALYPPFDNVAIRRLVTEHIDQRAFMEAVAGAVPELIKTDVGLFAPGTPFASSVGVDSMKGPGDPAGMKQALAAAGYKGEKVVILAASNFPIISAIAEVGADLLRRMGFDVDYQAMDWGSVVQRRASKEPPAKGGWNIFFTFLGGTGNILPAANLAIRANGAGAWFGWPDNPKQQGLLQAWFDATDQAAQRADVVDLQRDFFQSPSFGPLGMFFVPTAYTKALTGMPDGFPLFYGVRREG